MAANLIPYYQKTRSKCQCSHSDGHPINYLQAKTGPLNGVVVDYAYDVVRFFLAILTLGATTKVRGGLKDSSHEYVEAGFDCLECGKSGVMWTIEFGPYGVRFVTSYYGTYYKRKTRCSSGSLTFGDVRECIRKLNWNGSDYKLSTRNCGHFVGAFMRKMKSFVSNGYYAVLKGSNGYSYCVNNANKLAEEIVAANKAQRKITVVSMGHSERSVVISLESESGVGYFSYINVPTKFANKIKEISSKNELANIKQVEWGPDDTWAIVMICGFCYYYAYKNQSGPAEAIDAKQGNVSYVAMTPRQGEYVVGYGKNGLRYRGLSQRLEQRLVESNEAHKKINSVTLGRDCDNYVVVDDAHTTWTKQENHPELDEAVKEDNSRLYTVF